MNLTWMVLEYNPTNKQTPWLLLEASEAIVDFSRQKVIMRFQRNESLRQLSSVS
jgi:hypothetical protein